MRTETDVAEAITALGELWLELLFDDPVVRGARGDVICSPAGLWLALAALEACADGATREELRGVVGPVRARKVEATAVRALGREGAFIASARMSSRLPARPEFGTPSYAIEVGQPGLDGPHGLHRWSHGTDALLGQAAECADPAHCALLVSTVALRAEWERPFEPSFTRELPFTDAEGVTHRVPAMVAEVPVEDAWTLARPHGRVTVVELRARAGDRSAAPATPPVRVRFALGEDRQVPPAEVISASWAPAAQGSAIRGSRGSRRPEAVLLELPRLWLSGDIDMSPQLAALGVKRLFSPSAELPRMFSEPVHCDRAVQSCLVRFDEEGLTSETSAGTATDRPWANRAHFDGPGQLLRTAPVRLDRPFAVSVLDGSGTVPLLAGYQADRPGGLGES
ncbi:serpin family protein [Streptomyces sp. NPDC088124]|uniref:serpin family protein n=1 Tax=Streptomyces sp. NPDC088124 TaxID=3154654 RepID=UPI00343424B6